MEYLGGKSSGGDIASQSDIFVKGAIVKNRTSGSISWSSNWQTLNLNTTIHNDSDYYTATSDTVTTIEQDGIYQASGLVAINNMPSGDTKYVFGLYKNGSLIGYLTRGYASLPSTNHWGVSGLYFFEASASDTIDLRVHLNITLTGAITYTQCALLKVA